MVIKRKAPILMIVILGICLFLSLGFDTDVSAVVSDEGGSVKVSINDDQGMLNSKNSNGKKVDYFRIVTKSNNGGSFDYEGSLYGGAGDTFQFFYNAPDGYQVNWLKIGNIRIPATSQIKVYDYSFNSNNLNISAHYKKY